MKRKKMRKPKMPLMAQKAEKALKVAVAKVIEEHRQTGDPLIIWENGRVIKVSADQISRHR